MNGTARIRLGRSLVRLGLMAVAIAVGGCDGVDVEGDVERDAIINGETVVRNDTGVVAIYNPTSPTNYSLRCSGTYMGGKWVITRRDCLLDVDPTTFWVTARLSPGKTEGIPLSPTSNPNGSHAYVVSHTTYRTTTDVAMLKLSAPLSPMYALPPAGISGTVAVGDSLLCQGYGRFQYATYPDTGAGTLRKAWLRVSAVGVHLPTETTPRSDWPYQIRLPLSASGQIIDGSRDLGGPCFRAFSGGPSGGVALASVHHATNGFSNITEAYDVAIANSPELVDWIYANLATP